ncbi:MAG: MBL fold metallo-hydrolase [Clostridiales Family XIII bacterium]|nr:MBL fold metallo-hydrolase [Clostridiales Family XIII bacterium]
MLTWDDDHLVLIDTGFPGQISDFVSAIQHAGFSPEKLTHIVLTHQDIDHIGCAAELLKIAPNAIVLAHEDEAQYIDGNKTPLKLAKLLDNYNNLTAEQKAASAQMKAGYAKCKVSIEKTLTDKEILPVCGGIEVIHTPGHTPGHVSLFLCESGILVSGDALNITGGELTGANPDYTEDLELAGRSMKKALSYPYKAVVTYHGGHLKRFHPPEFRQ